MKLAKKILIIFLSLVLVSLTTISAFAQEDYGIAPCYANIDWCDLSFCVYDPNTAEVYVEYYGISGDFKKAEITVKIQKKVFLLFWDTVDIGEPNDEWVETSTALNGDFYNTFDVNGTGTYRALITVEFTGLDGSVDVVEETMEYKYS